MHIILCACVACVLSTFTQTVAVQQIPQNVSVFSLSTLSHLLVTRLGRGLGPSVGWVGSKFALHVMGWVGLGGIGWVAFGCTVSQLYCSERLIQSDVKITVWTVLLSVTVTCMHRL